MNTIERLESAVRGYCRSFPTTFARAEGHTLVDVDGREFLDFFAGAGALNYGHNHPALRERLVEYLMSNGPTHLLDMTTVAKIELLERIEEVLLAPRGLSYRVQFPGPTGTNAVEAALKLARKVTGRTEVVSFTNGFHGMTLGSLAITGNAAKRAGAGVPLPHATSMPFDGYHGEEVDTIEMLERYLSDRSSGLEKPAAFILETVQAEGGVQVASASWLKRLADLAKQHDVLLIVDDIQVGCGRTGPFFSFERAGLTPDIVCLSKSLSGYGLPFALTLIRPELDVWDPGEHNGTFRGFNPAFVTATAALEMWRDDAITRHVEELSARTMARLNEIAAMPDVDATVRGLGLIQGIEFSDPTLAGEVSAAAFERGLIIETAGPRGEVLKLLPPLLITSEAMERGLDIIAACVADATEGDRNRRAS